MNDIVRSGRSLTRSKNSMAKLTNTDVGAITEEIKLGKTRAEISNQYTSKMFNTFSA